MKSGLETTHGSQLERHKIEKQCAISLCREADQLTAGLRGSGFKDVLQIGGLAAQTRAVVNDLAINLSGCVVDKSHKANAFLFWLLEQTVDVLIGDLGERRVTFVKLGLRNFVHQRREGLTYLSASKLHQSQCRSLIKHDDQQQPADH